MKSLFLFTSCALFLGAALYLGQLMVSGNSFTREEALNPRVQLAVVPVAKRKFIVGDIIYLTDMKWVRRRVGDTEPRALTREDIDRKNTRYFSVTKDIAGGAIIAENVISWPTDLRFLPDILKVEYKALAVVFDKEGSIASQLWPGSHIDLVLAFNDQKKIPNFGNEAVRLIASNVRVLFNSNFPNVAKSKNTKKTNQKGLQLVLEVTRKQSETITLAHKMGTILPILRSTKEKGGGPHWKKQDDVDEINIGDLVLPSISDAEIDVPENKTYKIFIQRGGKLKTVTRDSKEVLLAKKPWLMVEKKL